MALSSLGLVACSPSGSSRGGLASTAAPAATTTATTARAVPVTTASTGPVATAAALLGDPLSPLRATRSDFRDARGRQVLLRGANLSERSKRPPFGGWLRPEHVDHLVRLGFDHVRFLLTWEAIEPRDGVFDDAYLDGVAKELAWFEERGIRVILDLHQDCFARRFGGDGAPGWALAPDAFPWLPDVIGPFPQNYANPKVIAQFDSFYKDATRKSRMAKAWAHAARRLKGSKAVAGYDLWNEPYPGWQLPWNFEATELASFEAELARAVRGEDADRVLFFEPYLLAGTFATTGVKVPDGDANAAYAPHWYDPVVDVRAMQGQTPAYDGDPSRTRNAFANLANHARGLDVPLWLGEYGIERERGGAADYVRHHAQLLDEGRMSACYWEVNPVQNDVFSPIDPAGKDHPIAAALAWPHPRAVAGTLERVHYDPTTRVLEVEWTEGRLGADAPTLLELPAKVYGSGPLDVTLPLDAAGSWRVERDATTGRLAAWVDPATPRHRLVVRPR